MGPFHILFKIGFVTLFVVLSFCVKEININISQRVRIT